MAIPKVWKIGVNMPGPTIHYHGLCLLSCFNQFDFIEQWVHYLAGLWSQQQSLQTGSTVFCIVMPCNDVAWFSETLAPYPKMKAVWSSKMLISYQISIWCHTPEYHNANLYCCANLKPWIKCILFYTYELSYKFWISNIKPSLMQFRKYVKNFFTVSGIL